MYDIERLEELARDHENVTVDLVLSSPIANGTPVDGRRFGMVTDAVAEDYAGPQALDGAKAYVAGPPAMVEAAVRLVQQRGVRRRDCHADAFYTEAEKAAVDKAG